ncbi:MAG: response regulator [Candidatus Hydrogenedentes bacterium]|nr:response regulator [Candidatus Hydrogenedentota bacterium]
MVNTESGNTPSVMDPANAVSHLKATLMMARNTAHDVNNLMGVVLGCSALVRGSVGAGHPGLKFLSEIESAAEKSGQLAQQLLAFTQGGHDRRRILSLNAFASQALLLEEQDLAPRVRVVRYIEPDLWDIEADPTQLSQIVMTLAINAVEAIEDEGRIVIVTRNIEIDGDFARTKPGLRPGRYACLTVEDTGQGMSAEALAHLFDAAPPAGLGIRSDLSQVSHAVTDLGGHISAYSDKGQGVTFMVYFPAVAAKPVAVAASPSTLPSGSETVLLIDDESLILDVTQKLLDQLGYRTLVAHNGQEALDIARTHAGPIDLALLDMAMPVMGGAETYPQLKRLRPNMKVVICSGLELNAISKALLEAGVSGFLQKPYQVTLLSQTIRRVLDN